MGWPFSSSVSFFADIPTELLEAARVDGASLGTGFLSVSPSIIQACLGFSNDYALSF